MKIIYKTIKFVSYLLYYKCVELQNIYKKNNCKGYKDWLYRLISWLHEIFHFLLKKIK